MGYTIKGKVLDKDKQPVPFVVLYASDSNAKPLTPTKSATADENGVFKIDSIEDTDFITSRMVGLATKTIPAKSLDKTKNILITLEPDDKTTLSTVEIIADKVKPKDKPKKHTPYYAIFLALFGLAILGTALIIKSKKK